MAPKTTGLGAGKRPPTSGLGVGKRPPNISNTPRATGVGAGKGPPATGLGAGKGPSRTIPGATPAPRVDNTPTIRFPSLRGFNFTDREEEEIKLLLDPSIIDRRGTIPEQKKRILAALKEEKRAQRAALKKVREKLWEERTFKARRFARHSRRQNGDPASVSEGGSWLWGPPTYKTLPMELMTRIMEFVPDERYALEGRKIGGWTKGLFDDSFKKIFKDWTVYFDAEGIARFERFLTTEQAHQGVRRVMLRPHRTRFNLPWWPEYQALETRLLNGMSRLRPNLVINLYHMFESWVACPHRMQDRNMIYLIQVRQRLMWMIRRRFHTIHGLENIDPPGGDGWEGINVKYFDFTMGAMNLLPPGEQPAWTAIMAPIHAQGPVQWALKELKLDLAMYKNDNPREFVNFLTELRRLRTLRLSMLDQKLYRVAYGRRNDAADRSLMALTTLQPGQQLPRRIRDLHLDLTPNPLHFPLVGQLIQALDPAPEYPSDTISICLLMRVPGDFDNLRSILTMLRGNRRDRGSLTIRLRYNAPLNLRRGGNPIGSFTRLNVQEFQSEGEMNNVEWDRLVAEINEWEQGEWTAEHLDWP